MCVIVCFVTIAIDEEFGNLHFHLAKSPWDKTVKNKMGF